MQFPRFPRHVWICTELLISVTVWLQGLQLRIMEVGGKWSEKRGVVGKGEGNKTKSDVVEQTHAYVKKGLVVSVKFVP